MARRLWNEWRTLTLSCLLLLSVLLGCLKFITTFGPGKQHVVNKQPQLRSLNERPSQKSDRRSVPRDQLTDRLDLAQTNRGAKKSFDGEVMAVGRKNDVLVAEGQNLESENDESAPVQSGILATKLSRDPKTGQLMIASFQSLTFTGSASSCREIGKAMVADASGSSRILHIVADSNLIYVVRICAGNGSVVLSCRSGGVTISPRRPRPDDGCAGDKA